GRWARPSLPWSRDGYDGCSAGGARGAGVRLSGIRDAQAHRRLRAGRLRLRSQRIASRPVRRNRHSPRARIPRGRRRHRLHRRRRRTQGAGALGLATAVRDETGDELAAPPLIRQRAAEALGGLRYFEGELVCTTAVAATEVEKLALARPGALAVDMESYPVARAAAAAGIPWLAIRAIVDPLRSSLPAFTRDPAGGYVGPAMKYALSGPRAAADLVRLATRARAAAAALEVALHRLRPMLGATEARA